MNLIAMTGRSVVSTAIRDRALKNGLLSSMVGLGSFFGPYLMGYVLDNYPPDTFLFVSVIIVIVDIVLFFVFYLFVNRILSSRNIMKDLSYTRIDTDGKIRYREALTTPGIPEIFVLFLLSGLIFGFISSIYSIYGYNKLKLSPTLIGLITGGGSLVQTIWAPITGKLYSYIEDKYLRTFAWIIILFAGISALLSAISPLYFIMSFVILNLGNSSYFTVEITRMSKKIDSKQFSFIFGTASSLIILGTSIAGFLSPLLYNVYAEANFLVACIFAAMGLTLILVNVKASSGQQIVQ